MNKLFILHPGKANYPEISAYMNYFSDRFEVHEGGIEEYKKIEGKDRCILWCIMGFYPNLPSAGFVIHDYRSLSVGKAAKIKDKLKKYLLKKPNLRIFQNVEIENEMGFKDRVKKILLPMGVPSFVYDIEAGKSNVSGRFCYIGEMSYERNFDKMLDAYIEFYDGEGELLLIGSPEESLYEKYSDTKGIVFLGRKPQKDTLEIVKNCDYAISFVPYHFPYYLQAPTKLLEYMALGVPVLCNDSMSNTRELNRFNYPANVVGKYIFDSGNIEDKNTQPVLGNDWDNVIEKSGIDDILMVL